MSYPGILTSVRPVLSDSCVRLEAYVRICVSLHRRSFVRGGWERADVDMQSCSRLSSRLCEVLFAKARVASSPEEQCRLSVQLYTLLGETGLVDAPSRRRSWEGLAAAALERFLCGRPEADASALSGGYYAWLLLLDYYYPLVPDPGDDWWELLLSAVSRWVSEYDAPRAGWPGTGLEETLLRLRVLNRLSYMYLLPVHDLLVRECCTACASRLSSGLDEATSGSLGQLYGLLQEGNASPRDPGLRARLSGELYRRGQRSPAGSDMWWDGLSYRVSELCAD